ncbi:MAG: TetR/AcrR family transcriptional regulator [Haloechinothrix sp.]
MPAGRPAGARAGGRSQEILATFTRHVAERGYDGTNFGDIASELGMSKGTIVHHYGTKDRLLAALHEGYMTRRLAEARLLIERTSSPGEQLAGLLYAFMLYQVEDREATVAFQREVVRIARHEAGRQLRDEYLDLVRGVAGAGVAQGVFRSCDVELQTLLLMGAAQWAWTWFDPGGAKTVEEAGAALVDLVLGGMLARRTRLRDLADPNGRVAALVRECIADVASTETR